MMVTNAIPALLQFYVGAWADIFGRKRLMYAVCIATLLNGVVSLFLEIYLSSPKEWIILSQLPLSLVGGFPVWILSLFSFVADISEPKQRGFRMIMITLASSWGSPPAPYIGALIFDYGNQKVKNGNVNF